MTLHIGINAIIQIGSSPATGHVGTIRDIPPIHRQSRLISYACYTFTCRMHSNKKPATKTSRRQPNHVPRALRRVEIVAKATLPTRYGDFTVLGARGKGPNEEAAVLVRGKLTPGTAPLVRIHSQCLTGDVFTSQRCDCRAQLELALKKIGASRSGILLYLPQEGRGIGLMNKIRAYELQDQGMDTVEANESLGFAADSRDYAFSAAVLKALGARRIRLLSNNPDKVFQLQSAGIRVIERIPCEPPTTKRSRSYLKTKAKKMGHLLNFRH
jgi:GTP cyclohydrolase II